MRTSSYGATELVIRVASRVITRPKSSGRDPAGEPVRSNSTFVGGLKTLPLRISAA